MAAFENLYRNHSELGAGAGLVSKLLTGGQLGYGFKASAFDAATPLAMPPAVIVVLTTPTMWDNIGDNGMLRQTVKSMFETHAKAVTGIDVSYTLENQGQPVGHDGQELKVPTKTTRAAVDPNFTYSEVSGNLVWNIHRRWIWDISDPDSGTAFEHEGPNVSDGELSPYTMSSYALTLCVIQYDKTMHPDRIIDGTVITNIYPTATGELGIERTEGTTKVPERAITYTGYIMHNERTKEIARTVANAIKLRGETYKVAAANCDDQQPVNSLLKDGISGQDLSKGIMDDPALSGGFNYLNGISLGTNSWQVPSSIPGEAKDPEWSKTPVKTSQS